MAIQTLGGAGEDKVARLQLAEAPMVLASLTISSGMIPLLTGDYPFVLGDPAREQGGINFYRQDDWCATAYFYLDHPENDLPPLANVEERTRGLT